MSDGGTTISIASSAAALAPRPRQHGRERTARDGRELSKLFESLPPHAIEAEMSLLGSIIIEPQVIGDVIFIVRRGEDFYKPANGAIFDAMVELYDRHSTLDIVQLHQLLVDRNVLEAVGGQDYLVQLASAVPSAANAAHYARLVREKATIRELITAAGDILHEAYHSADDAQAILDRAESLIFHIAQRTEQTKIEVLEPLLNELMQRIQASDGHPITGIKSGFSELDDLTTGLQNGEMVIIAARPSMGKTALALNMAENIAMIGEPVGLFSLEMSKQQLVHRLLCARAEVDSHKLRRGMLNSAEKSRLTQAAGQLVLAPIYIDDTPGLTMLQLRAKARRMAAKHKVKAIFVDYLQLVTSGWRTESRQIEVSDISRGVKAMARELQVPVVCLSQLNRAAEQREGHRPRMSDLRESGSLEQDADVVMLLHREDYYHKDDPEWLEDHPESLGVAELILTKQRNGPTGVIKLAWIAQSTRFRDYAHVSDHDGHAASRPRAVFSPADDREGAPFGGGFGPRQRTGPVSDFRDGGGPSRAGDDDEFDIPV